MVRLSTLAVDGMTEGIWRICEDSRKLCRYTTTWDSRRVLDLVLISTTSEGERYGSSLADGMEPLELFDQLWRRDT